MAITNTTLTNIGIKRLSGKAQTSIQRSLAQEPLGSTIQTTAGTVFGEVLPNTPDSSSGFLNMVQSGSDNDPGTVVLVDFDLRPLEAYSLYQNDLGNSNDELDQGDNDPGNPTTYHAYGLFLTGGFAAAAAANNFDTHASTPTSINTNHFVDGYYLTGSRGKLQIVPEFVSSEVAGVGGTNPYTPIVFNNNGGKISATSAIDWYLDPYAGVLFIQDPIDYGTPQADGDSPNANNNIPDKVRAFIYVGKYQDEISDAANVDLHFSSSDASAGFSFGNTVTASFAGGDSGLTVQVGDGTNQLLFGSASDNVTFNSISGSFSGSFEGDGSGLTNITADSVNISHLVSASVNGDDQGQNNEIAIFDGGQNSIKGSSALTFNGNELRVAGDIIAENYIVSSSVTYMTQSFSSGSTIFGDGNGDTHKFTGSIQILHTSSADQENNIGLEISGSGILINNGEFGKIAMGQYNVGNEIGTAFPLTGSGLIISQSFGNEATTHNMIKIGETELVDITGSLTADAFLINVRNKSLVISSSDLQKPLMEVSSTAFKVYNPAESATDPGIAYTNTALQFKDTNITLVAGTGGVNMALNATHQLSTKPANGFVPYFSQEPSTTPTPMKYVNRDNFLGYIGGAVTASAVSSSGLLFASLSEAQGTDTFDAVVYDTSTGRFYHTSSFTGGGGQGGLFIGTSSAGDGTDTLGSLVELGNTASFAASGTGLSVDHSGDAVITYTINPNTLFGGIDTATIGSFTASYAETASKVVVTDNEETDAPRALVFANPDASANGVDLQSDASGLTYNPKGGVLMIGSGASAGLDNSAVTGSLQVYSVDQGSAQLGDASFISGSFVLDLFHPNSGSFTINHISESSGRTPLVISTAGVVTKADADFATSIVSDGGGLDNISGSSTVQGQIKIFSSSDGTFDTLGVAVDIVDLGTSGTPTFAGLTVTGDTTIGNGSDTIKIGTGSNDTVTIGHPAKTVTIAGSASIAGDLIVQGTTTSIQTANLNVEDQFILLNSGSTSGDGGIIVQTGASGVGTALFYDDDTQRWGLTGLDGTSWNETDESPEQYLVTVSSSGAAPTGNPSNFGNSEASYRGMMFVDTSDEHGLYIFF